MDSNCNYIDGVCLAACCYLNTGVYKKNGNMIFRLVKVDFRLFEGRLRGVGLYFLHTQFYAVQKFNLVLQALKKDAYLLQNW